MKTVKWKIYLLWIALTEAVGALSGWLNRAGTKRYEAQAAKPPLTPPAAVFPVVGAVLYALMGIGAARVYLAPASAQRTRALGLFAVQLAVNFLWSILFFSLERYGLAFWLLVVLGGLILAMIVSFRPVDPLAAWLQVPYLLWVTFAAYLNAGVWYLNR